MMTILENVKYMVSMKTSQIHKKVRLNCVLKLFANICGYDMIMHFLTITFNFINDTSKRPSKV